MTGPGEDVSQRTAAIVATIGLVVTLLGVGIAVGCGAPPDLARTGDAAAVAGKIAAAGGLFRVAVLGWLVAILGDIVRAWALYAYFRGVNRSVAQLAAWWMLLHDAIFGFSLASLLAASDVVGGAGAFAGMAASQAHPVMLLLLRAQEYGFHIGLLFFSFHLLLNGYLVLRSGSVPRVLGALLVLASVGYLVDSTAHVAFRDPPAIVSRIVALPNAIGEIALIVWLAVKGGRTCPPSTDAAPGG